MPRRATRTLHPHYPLVGVAVGILVGIGAGVGAGVAAGIVAAATANGLLRSGAQVKAAGSTRQGVALAGHTLVR